ncbi:alpha/beta fold hydrolase [Agrobacterium pusense]|uniref:alpha/beta fold hydrolase n=1 Tax=Agrobacterium pusense TaxID=648995 RepID=UPI001CB78B61|nr:alpha/beta hydrolase [Agrobacterium pusense]
MNIATTNGIELAWDSFGEANAEPILLIAGLGGQMIRWSETFCNRLAASGYRVIRFDNRDAGYSTHFTTSATPDFGALAAALGEGRRPDVPYTLYDMAADAIGLLDVLKITRAHVVGRSMGGMIAQILASDHADRVISLTSIMSSTGNPSLPQAKPDVMAMMIRPAPYPAVDPEGILAVRLAFARRISGTGGHSTKRPIAPLSKKKCSVATIRAGRCGRSPPWRWPATGDRILQKSRCRRSSSTEQKIL